MWPRVGGLRSLELGTPGEMRANIVERVLSGEKTATTGLLATGYHDESEELEHPGERLALVGNDGTPVATLEIIDAVVMRFDEVGLEHAVAEGEGWSTLEDWRQDHVSYWNRNGTEVGDDTEVVCISFRLADS
ncbi:MAG: ASCH domain-containing protein [Acidimicrobiia bacterium]|nr:ASCH domain-containing protein [Acidimicrobiia bacterium]